MLRLSGSLGLSKHPLMMMVVCCRSGRPGQARDAGSAVPRLARSLASPSPLPGAPAAEVLRHASAIMRPGHDPSAHGADPSAALGAATRRTRSMSRESAAVASPSQGVCGIQTHRARRGWCRGRTPCGSDRPLTSRRPRSPTRGGVRGREVPRSAAYRSAHPYGRRLGAGISDRMGSGRTSREARRRHDDRSGSGRAVGTAAPRATRPAPATGRSRSDRHGGTQPVMGARSAVTSRPAPPARAAPSSGTAADGVRLPIRSGVATRWSRAHEHAAVMGGP
ncbi:hypothetical protein UA75_09715 [Actinoalloteichus sp. GBA129-24]|uniref:Uncharacterized protein n=1 Tax=Actinoalloteichus fjordicus TaxID=1612552 RepID=A0AAC9LC66_9PSEU|nr:hypothetical protein UA74_09745 [Actinoalloteichus fjordicus]APU19958.1 hypothetical protein UA75_09715 [Actinoalloteichus sp. GBA129-24]